MLKNKWSMVNALQFVKSKRNIVCPNTGFSKQLLIFDQYLKHFKYDKSKINDESFKDFYQKVGNDSNNNGPFIELNMLYYQFNDYIDQYFENNIDSNSIIQFVNEHHLRISDTEFWGKTISDIFLKQHSMGNIAKFIDLIIVLFDKKLINNNPTKFVVYLASNINESMLNEENGESYCQYLGKLFGLLLAKKHFTESIVYIFCQLASFSVDKFDDIGIEVVKENCGYVISSTIETLKSLNREQIIKKVKELNIDHLVFFRILY